MSEKTVTSHKRSASDCAVSPVTSSQVIRVHSASAENLLSSPAAVSLPNGMSETSKVCV